jgi:hypothetical protein
MRKVKIKKIKKKVLQPIVIKPKIKLKPIKITGFWCEYYPGRLPYPIECSYNKSSPRDVIFIHGKEKVTRYTPKCPKCKRSVKFPDWKAGKWDKVKQEIEKGADLREQPSPIKDDEI